MTFGGAGVAVFTILGPLAAAAAIPIARRRAGTLALLGAGIGVVAAPIALGRVAGGARAAILLPGLPDLPLRLVVDPLAALLTMVVATVSLLVFIYATGYMRGEPATPRFFAGLAFFSAAMQTLVLAGDWLLFLVAWELIAAASYLLIGHWFERPGVGAAATRAFVTTRAADLGLYLGIVITIARAGTSDMAAIGAVGGWAATLAGLAFLLAAMGKAAQAPLQGWLQDAMAGPTPVSALLHSATLVVAGVILLLRAYPLLGPGTLLLAGLVGGVTALLTGLMASAARDLKRLLAASTSSQLGLMLLALGAGAPGAAAIHLVAQAATKSSLFLGAGIFQHARNGTGFSELRGVGRARRGAAVGFTIAALGLAGLPPLAGFWTKDAIVAAAFLSPRGGVLGPLALVVTTLTGLYVARALRLIWRDAGSPEELAAPADSGVGPTAMGLGLAGLVFLAATLGLAVGPIAALLRVDIAVDLFSLSAVLSLIAAAFGLVGGWFLPAARPLGSLSTVAERGFQLGGGWSNLVARPLLAAARVADRGDQALHRGVHTVGARAIAGAAVLRAFDGWIHAVVRGVGRDSLAVARASRLVDERGIDGIIGAIVDGTRDLGERVRRLQSGLVHQELLLSAGGIVLLLVILVLGGLAAR